MLLGQFIQKVAPKNRIALPAKFRQELGDKVVISQGFESSLLILSTKNWQNLVDKSIGDDFTRKDIRDLSRFLFAGALEIQLDNQGRFILPQHLREFAKIKKQVVFLGLIKWVEIWDLNTWLKYKNNLTRLSKSAVKKLESAYEESE